MDVRDFVSAEIAAAADDVHPVPLSAWNDGGDVVIMCDPATARTLAAGWLFLHTDDQTHHHQRPRWHDDLVAILTAAGYADIEAGTAKILPGDFVLTPITGGAR